MSSGTQASSQGRHRMLRLVQQIHCNLEPRSTVNIAPVSGGANAGGILDTWKMPRYVTWGKAAHETLPRLMKKIGCQRALLMVSSTLRRETSAVEDIANALGSSCVAIWDGMPAHTPREAVLSVAEAATNADADVIVTIGGGSLTDGAKAARIAMAVGAKDADALGSYHSKLHSNPIRVKQISIPTTLSAGEYSPWTGVTDTKRKFKDPYLFVDALPAAVILDPELAAKSPKHLVLSTGIRAVDHCVEAMCSLDGNPCSDGTCSDALALLVAGLRGVQSNPLDREAHIKCQIGTWKSVQGISAGPKAGASHAIGHVMGGAFGVPHGETSCVALPAVIEWNFRSESEPILRRQEAVIRAFQFAGAGDVRPCSTHQSKSYKSEAALLVAGFVEELCLPRSLAQVNINTSAQLQELAEKTMDDPLVHSNPRRITSWKQVREILELMV